MQLYRNKKDNCLYCVIGSVTEKTEIGIGQTFILFYENGYEDVKYVSPLRDFYMNYIEVVADN